VDSGKPEANFSRKTGAGVEPESNSPCRYFASGDKIDKTANCLAGHGGVGLENIKCRRSTGG